MTPLRPRLTAVALTGLLTTGLALGWPSNASAATDIPVQVRAVTVSQDEVRLVLAADGLPPGTTLDPQSVRVSSQGEAWTATAEPVTGSGGTIARTAVIAVDTSGSMGAKGIADAQSAARRFLDGVPPDVAVGLVTFANEARLLVTPTADRAAVGAALAAMTPAGNTTLYDGIALSLAALGSAGDRALILLSDGRDTASTATLASTVAALGASAVSLDLVSFGSGDGQRQVLEQLAAPAHGRVSQADTGNELGDIFATAARTLVNQVNVTAAVPAGATGTTVELSVTIKAGDATADAVVQVAVPARPAPVDRPGLATSAAPLIRAETARWLLPTVLIVSFLSLFLLSAAAMSLRPAAEGSSRRRTREIDRYTLGAAPVVLKERSPAAVTQAAIDWAGRTVRRRGLEETWGLALDRAAVPLRPQEWMLVRVGISLAVTALAVIVLPLPILTGLLAAVISWLLTGLYLRTKGNRRLARFATALPDVLQLVAGSLRSGFSLPQAVANAGKDAEEPIGGELARAMAETRLGVSLEDALDRVATRMRSQDLAWTVMAIRIAREVGGNLAEVLLSTAATMRDRERIQRQVRTLSAEGRLSAYVLIALPVGITLFMVAFRGSYIAPLVTDPIGVAMTVYGVISVLAGTWWMSRLIKLEV